MATPVSMGMKKSDLVLALEQESETLQNITDYFEPLMRHFRIFFFWETERTNLKLLRADYIVTVDSAAPVRDNTERAGIAADHSGMVKFEDPTSYGFQVVVSALVRYCDDAPAAIARRLEEAEAAVRRERKREALGIVRHCGLPAPSAKITPLQPIPTVSASSRLPGAKRDRVPESTSGSFRGCVRYIIDRGRGKKPQATS